MSLTEPYCTIICDKCGAEDHHELTELACNHCWSNEGIEEEYKESDWVFAEDGQTFCPECSKAAAHE